MSRVLKWTVSVDDRPHLIGAGPVVLVACQHAVAEVQVWTVEATDGPVTPTVPVQVFGTGQPLPDDAVHIGSTLTARGALVWHLFRVPA